MENEKKAVLQESLEPRRTRLSGAVEVIKQSGIRAGSTVASLVFGKPGLVKHVSPDRPPEDESDWSFRPNLRPPTY